MYLNVLVTSHLILPIQVIVQVGMDVLITQDRVWSNAIHLYLNTIPVRPIRLCGHMLFINFGLPGQESLLPIIFIWGHKKKKIFFYHCDVFITFLTKLAEKRSAFQLFYDAGKNFLFFIKT